MGASILVGNGINQCFDNVCISWGALLDELTVNKSDITKFKDSNMPYPLQIVARTRNNVHNTLKEKLGKDCDERLHNTLYGVIQSQEQMDFLQKLLGLPVQDIMTTNYGFEMEAASIGVIKKALSHNQLQKMTSFFPKDEGKADQKTGRAEGRYFIRTFLGTQYNGMEKRIWHVHGHAKNKSSIIIGHHYYANQLYYMKKYSDENGNKYMKNQEKGVNTNIRSWIDAFILNDVYVLGFGYDYSEMDLWWLLERKRREKADVGKVYYYTPKKKSDKNDATVLDLLDAHGVEIRDMGFEMPDYGKGEKCNSCKNRKYQEFYLEAIQDIENNIKSGKH